jgi:hypothetical protein
VKIKDEWIVAYTHAGRDSGPHVYRSAATSGRRSGPREELGPEEFQTFDQVYSCREERPARSGLTCACLPCRSGLGGKAVSPRRARDPNGVQAMPVGPQIYPVNRLIR